MTPPLEDRLDELAAGIHAPPTGEARAAVGRRSLVLRRRRRALAAGSGALVVAAVVGAVAVASGPAPDDTTTAADGTGGDLPAIVIDLDGWVVDTIVDTDGVTIGGATGESVQTFGTPEGGDGPRVVVTHAVASDTLGPEPGDHEVMVGDNAGQLRDDGTGDLVLRWQDPALDAIAQVEATGLSRDEVLEFADGLVAKDDEISHPATNEDTLGFEQTADVRGLVERSSPARRIIQTDDAARADLRIEEVDADEFAAIVDHVQSPGSSEAVTVMGRPGLLVSLPGGLQWEVTWQPTAGTAARLVLTDVDRATVDTVLGALVSISEQEWNTLESGANGHSTRVAP